MIARRTARLIARGTCNGIEEALGHFDGWQVRHGATLFVTRADEAVTVHRAVGGALRLQERLSPLPHPAPVGQGYFSPAQDAGTVAVSGDQEITVLAPDGTTRWTFPHEPWSETDSGTGACAFTADGRHVIATVPGPLVDGDYPGDLCIALDAATGALVAQHTLDAASAMYQMRQPLAGRDLLFVSAGQGQDGHCSYIVALSAEGFRVLPAGEKDEPIAGLDADGRRMLKLDEFGESITAYSVTDDGGTVALGRIRAAQLVGPDSEDRVVGRPGFVDADTILAATAEEYWSEEARHFLIDAGTLHVTAEIEYPFPVGPDPIALNDGTWITASGDQVFWWAVAAKVRERT